MTGQAFQWSASGSNNGTAFTGTFNEQLGAVTFNGKACIQDLTTRTVTGGASSTQTVWELPNRQVLAIQPNGAASPLTCTSDTINFPTTITASTSIAGTATFSDGSSYVETWTVTGSANFTYSGYNTPTACWVIKQTFRHSDGSSETDTLLFDPGVANFVKETGSQTANGVTTTYSYLFSSSVTAD
jgi:hypothetical protein